MKSRTCGTGIIIELTVPMTGGPVPPMEFGPVGGNCGGNLGTCWCPPEMWNFQGRPIVSAGHPPWWPPAWWLGGGPAKLGGGPDMPPIWTTMRLPSNRSQGGALGSENCTSFMFRSSEPSYARCQEAQIGRLKKIMSEKLYFVSYTDLHLDSLFARLASNIRPN